MDQAQKRRATLWQLTVCLFAVGGWVALREIYVRSGYAFWAGIFGASNQSAWEQSKALFFSLLACCLPELFFSRLGLRRLAAACTAELVLLPVLFLAFYYTYTGALDVHSDAADLLGGAVLIALCGVLGRRRLSRPRVGLPGALLGAALALSLCALYGTLTLWPPEVGLFRDPRTGRYGMAGRQGDTYTEAVFASLPAPLPACVRSGRTAEWEERRADSAMEASFARNVAAAAAMPVDAGKSFLPV